MIKPFHLFAVILIVLLTHAALLFFLLNSTSFKLERSIQSPAIMGAIIAPVEKPTPIVEQSKPLVMPESPKIVEQRPKKNILATNNSPKPVQVSNIPNALAPSEIKSEIPKEVKVEAVVLPHTDADYINNPAPDYPPMSRRAREEGSVILIIKVLANGMVGDIKIKESSGFKRLDQAAIKTVKKWQFVPAKKGKLAIGYDYELPIEFSLN